MSPTISSLLFHRVSEVTPDPALSTLPPCTSVFCVGVCEYKQTQLHCWAAGGEEEEGSERVSDGLVGCWPAFAG